MSEPSTIFYKSVFYESVANAIDTAQGTLFLDLNPYRWKTSLLDLTIIWSVANPCTAKVEFKYGEGLLKTASVEFNPPVKLFITGNLGAGLLSSVRYDADGRPFEIQIVPSTQFKPDALQKLKSILSMRSTAGDLFLGSSFGVLNTAVQVNDLYEAIAGPPTMIQRVRFKAPDSQPGLALDFKDQATIIFSKADKPNPADLSKDPTSFDNFVEVRKGSRVEIKEIDYFLNEWGLTCALKTFNAVVEQGVLSSPGLRFELKGGAQIRFDEVDISSGPNKPAQVKASSGALTGELTDHSDLKIPKSGPVGLSFFSLKDGSQTNIQGFELSIIGTAASITVGAGSTLKLNVFESRIGFGKKSFLRLQNRQVDAKFSGSWGDKPSAGEYAIFQFSPFDFAGVTGEIYINADSHFIISNGHVRSSELTFDTKARPGAIGSFTVFDFDIVGNDQLKIPQGFKIIAATGGKFSGAQPDAPLSLKSGSDYPVGKVTLNLPFRKMLIGDGDAFSLQNGRNVVLNLQSADDDSFSGDIRLSATAVLGYPASTSLDKNIFFDVNIDLSDVTFSKPSTGQLSMTGNLKASAQLNLTIPMTTPFVGYRTGLIDKDGEAHTEYRAFPLNLTCKLHQPIDIPVTPFSITGGLVHLAPFTIQPTFEVIIPAGLGEHQWSDGLDSADGTHGPDEDQHRQEAITDTFLGCRIHFYLYEGGYDFQSEIKISIIHSTLVVDVLKFVSNTDIGFHQDGCDGAVYGAIAGIIGLVLGKDWEYGGQSHQELINRFVTNQVVAPLYKRQYLWYTKP